MASPEEIQQELDSVEYELQAIELQISELHERQVELNSTKNRLKKKLKQATEQSPSAGTSTAQAVDLQSFVKKDFPWSKKVQKNLDEIFHLSAFRPLQLQTINITMSGKDVFLVMPTGGGKSLCYQLPAVSSEGFTLVIAPLVSLMEDQLMYLERLGISAATLNASSTKEHNKWVLNAMLEKSSEFKLLYVTPEKIAKSKMFMSKLEKAYHAGRLTRIAVDEVHCCSQWGHDFRPDYKVLGILKRQFPNVPLIGLTATATSNILKDCQKILCVENPLTLTASFNRPNLYYEVRDKPSSTEDFTEDIAKLITGRYKDQSGIIYCFSQKDSEYVAVNLQKMGIRAKHYHANMEAADKSDVHRNWTDNKIQVVVATVAFGMGIDKPDVRFIIHHSLSKSMENYYQESGRAGRDDKKADCILYYSFTDIFKVSAMVVMENVGQQKLYQMVSFCQDKERCRRVQIAQHFDEVWDSKDCNQMCDNCRHDNAFIIVNIANHAKELVKILEQAHSLDEKLTPLKLIDSWLGKGISKLRVLSVAPPGLNRVQIEAVIAHLLVQQIFREDFSFTPYTTISYIKLGPKAGLLKNDKHTIMMRMKKDSTTKDPVKSPKLSSGDKNSAEVKKERGDRKRPLSDDSRMPKKVKKEEDVQAAVSEGESSPPVVRRDRPSQKKRKYTKKTKNQQNHAKKYHESPGENTVSEDLESKGSDQTDGTSPSANGHLIQARLEPTAIEVEVQIDNANHGSSENIAAEPQSALPPKTKRKVATPKKKIKPGDDTEQPPSQQRAALLSAPSEVSIISAAAVEELSHLHRYYSKQLQRINYISRENLHDSDSGVLICNKGPLKNFRLGWRSSIARTARSLWARLSTRRKFFIRK